MRLLTIVALSLALIASAQAQVKTNSNLDASFQSIRIFGGGAADTVGNSLTDTTSAVRIGGFPYCTVKFTLTDSAHIDKFYVDTRARGMSTWTLTDSSTTDITNTGLGGADNYTEVALRSATVDKLQRIEGEFRLRVVFNSSGNGVTNKKYYIHYIFGR